MSRVRLTSKLLGILAIVAIFALLSGPSVKAEEANPPEKGGYLDRLASDNTSSIIVPADWRNLRPTESFLRSVSMLPEGFAVNCQASGQKSKGWIVGESGVILSYCNGVWDHAITVESVPTTLFGVQAISPTLATAVGVQGTILHYMWDNFANDYVWTKYPIPVGNETLYSVAVVESSPGNYTGWAVGTADGTGKGVLVRGTLNSNPPRFDTSWTNLTSSYPALPQVDYYHSVQMLATNNGWAVGGKEGQYGVIIHWDGSKWALSQSVGSVPLLGIHMRSSNDGWAVGKSGSIYHYNGSSWSSVPSPVTGILTDVGFDKNGVGWIVGYDGVILEYHGADWVIVKDKKTDDFDYRSVDFSSGHGWLVGLNTEKAIGGQILELDEGIWYAVTPPTDNRLNAVSIVAENSAWAVGHADSQGGTIIRWDGKHWQRWFQSDLPIPAANLYAINMVSENNGWAAGDPISAGLPAVFLQWDGHRWRPSRYNSPVNVRVNSLDMLDEQTGWAVADAGDAVPKYDNYDLDEDHNYWSANHTCSGIYYQLRSTSMVTATNTLGWDAWAVGTATNPGLGEYFLRFAPGCATSNAWIGISHPRACDPVPDPDDGWSATKLRGIRMQPGPWGFATGDYKNRASIYSYNEATGQWSTAWCKDKDSNWNPSRLYAADIVNESGVGWFAGYYTNVTYVRKLALLMFKDSLGVGWVGDPFPLNGRNIYHRPILGMDMLSDTMGWAVGSSEADVVDGRSVSVIYQYPFPNYTIEVEPQNPVVRPGQSTMVDVSINPLGSFTTTVSLDTWWLPPGISTSAPFSVSVGTAQPMQISAAPGTVQGEYDILLLASATFRSGDHDYSVVRHLFMNLTVTNHPVNSVSPTRGPAGTLVTISGQNFGGDPGAANRSSSSYHVVLAGKQMPASAVESWADSQITVRVPNDLSLFPHGPEEGPVYIVTGGESSNATLSFLVENYISSVSAQPQASDLLVTIQGTGFGSVDSLLLTSTDLEHISVNGERIPAGQVLSWNNTTIEFTLAGSHPGGPVTVTSNGYTSNTRTLVPPGSNKKIYLPMLRR